MRLYRPFDGIESNGALTDDSQAPQARAGRGEADVLFAHGSAFDRGAKSLHQVFDALLNILLRSAGARCDKDRVSGAEPFVAQLLHRIDQVR